MAVVLLLSIGAAVDIGRWLHARDQTVQAVDAAVLGPAERPADVELDVRCEHDALPLGPSGLGTGGRRRRDDRGGEGGCDGVRRFRGDTAGTQDPGHVVRGAVRGGGRLRGEALDLRVRQRVQAPADLDERQMLLLEAPDEA